MADRDSPTTNGVIDRIYTLLDLVAMEEKALRARKGKHRALDVIDYPAIMDAVDLLSEQGFGNRLGLSAMDLDKLQRWRGTVYSDVLTMLAGRIQRLLRELEGEFRGLVAKETPGDNPFAPTTPIDQPLKVIAVEWVANPFRDNAELLAELSTLVTEAIQLARGSNLPPNRAAFSEIERAQLIAILETALAMLKAPLAERGLFKKVSSAAGAVASAAVKKEAEIGLALILAKVREVILRAFGI